MFEDLVKAAQGRQVWWITSTTSFPNACSGKMDSNKLCGVTILLWPGGQGHLTSIHILCRPHTQKHLKHMFPHFWIHTNGRIYEPMDGQNLLKSCVSGTRKIIRRFQSPSGCVRKLGWSDGNVKFWMSQNQPNKEFLSITALAHPPTNKSTSAH